LKLERRLGILAEVAFVHDADGGFDLPPTERVRWI
jgi:hypothetical protein